MQHLVGPSAPQPPAAPLQLIYDERPIKFAGEEQEQLWRYFNRRCGMGRLEMQQVIWPELGCLCLPPARIMAALSPRGLPQAGVCSRRGMPGDEQSRTRGHHMAPSAELSPACHTRPLHVRCTSCAATDSLCA